MRRREFLSVVGGAAAAWPSVARAQQAYTTIGILDPGNPYVFDAFIEGMRRLGYIEGKNVTYVRRSAAGNGSKTGWSIFDWL